MIVSPARAISRDPLAVLIAYFEEHPVALDATLLTIVTLVAAGLRLALLGDVPYGLHPDEAQIGTDVHRLLDGHWIGVYTEAALGQPAGHSYLTLPSIWLLGDTVLALRLPLTLSAIAAVPLLYLLVRTSTFGRAEAFFAAGMLAVSNWHLLYSRVAHWSISYGTVVLAVLLLVMLGINRRKRWLVAGAGAVFGLGLYTYNIYPIAIAAVVAWLALLTVVHMRGEAWRWWWRSLVVFLGVALIVALPMINYVRDPDALYWRHFNNYENQRVTSSEAYEDADFLGKTEILAKQARRFVSLYVWDSTPDYVDGNGLRPVFDMVTVALIVGGIVVVVRRWRDPLVLAAVCCVIIIPLPAVLQTQSVLRQPVAAAPFLMFFAALPLAHFWREGLQRRGIVGIAAAAFAVAALGYVAVDTGVDYFGRWAGHPLVRQVYFSEMTTASVYMRQLPDNAYVYLYSERAPFRLEMRQYLAPEVQGEDRSREYSDEAGSIDDIDRGRPVSFVLMGPYTGLLERIRSGYPGGRTVEATRDGKREFIAYELPPDQPFSP